jgi:hypothetical protein
VSLLNKPDQHDFFSTRGEEGRLSLPLAKYQLRVSPLLAMTTFGLLPKNFKPIYNTSLHVREYFHFTRTPSVMLIQHGTEL